MACCKLSTLKPGLLQQLREMMPDDLTALQVFGDPAYPQCAHLLGGYSNPAAAFEESAWNTRMSKVIIVVEWGFKEIITP